MNNNSLPITQTLKLPDYLSDMKQKAVQVTSAKALEEYLYEFLPMTIQYPSNKNERYKTILTQ